MDGTTLCPHCNTRFRIAGSQFEAHQGMVRCGHCMQPFDARPGFIPDVPDPQLELPIVDRVAHAAEPPQTEISDLRLADTPQSDSAESNVDETAIPEQESSREAVIPPDVHDNPAVNETGQDHPAPSEPLQISPEHEEEKAGVAPDEIHIPDVAEGGETSVLEAGEQVADAAGEASVPQDETAAHVEPETHPDEVIHTLDFSDTVLADKPADEVPKARVLQSPMQVDLDEREEEAVEPNRPPRRKLAWVLGSVALVLLLLAQAAFFFRVELAARLPGLKPALVSYCGLLNCTVPLPQNADLMSIESSELEADPEHANQITLVALLRNRAPHIQAFPVLELTLNDTDDKAVARRIFKPADYLPSGESEAAGLLPNREINIRVRLDTTDLRPTGYRLALHYPQ